MYDQLKEEIRVANTNISDLGDSLKSVNYSTKPIVWKYICTITGHKFTNQARADKHFKTEDSTRSKPD